LLYKDNCFVIYAYAVFIKATASLLLKFHVR
jgi:hypothetical protein